MGQQEGVRSHEVSTHSISKFATKQLRIGKKKSKGLHQHKLPLLTALSNILILMEMLENLDEDELDMDVFDDLQLPKGVTQTEKRRRRTMLRSRSNANEL